MSAQVPSPMSRVRPFRAKRKIHPFVPLSVILQVEATAVRIEPLLFQIFDSDCCQTICRLCHLRCGFSPCFGPCSKARCVADFNRRVQTTLGNKSFLINEILRRYPTEDGVGRRYIGGLPLRQYMTICFRF